MVSSRTPLLSRTTDKITSISHPSSDNIFTYWLVWVFQYDLVTTEYRGYNNQELQAGKVPTNARAAIESFTILVNTVTVLTEDRTRMD